MTRWKFRVDGHGRDGTVDVTVFADDFAVGRLVLSMAQWLDLDETLEVTAVVTQGPYRPGAERCPVHVGVVEPCPTFEAYIAGGL